MKNKNKTLQIDKETANECIKAINDLHTKMFHLDALFWLIKHIDWQDLQSDVAEARQKLDLFSLTMVGELGAKISTECLDSACYLETTIKEELEKIAGKKGDD